MEPTPIDFKTDCDVLRVDLKEIAARTIALMKHSVFENILEKSNAGEMKANTMLAFRHLEDAAMRIGKAIQAYSGGESPLGGPSTPVAQNLSAAFAKDSTTVEDKNTVTDEQK